MIDVGRWPVMFQIVTLRFEDAVLVCVYGWLSTIINYGGQNWWFFCHTACFLELNGVQWRTTWSLHVEDVRWVASEKPIGLHQPIV